MFYKQYVLSKGKRITVSCKNADELIELLNFVKNRKDLELADGPPSSSPIQDAIPFKEFMINVNSLLKLRNLDSHSFIDPVTINEFVNKLEHIYPIGVTGAVS